MRTKIASLIAALTLGILPRLAAADGCPCGPGCACPDCPCNH
jgi:hypothetical protein